MNRSAFKTIGFVRFRAEINIRISKVIWVHYSLGGGGYPCKGIVFNVFLRGLLRWI